MIESDLGDDQVNSTCLAASLYRQCSCDAQQHHNHAHYTQDEENAARLIFIARFAADRSNDRVRVVERAPLMNDVLVELLLLRISQSNWSAARSS